MQGERAQDAKCGAGDESQPDFGEGDECVFGQLAAGAHDFLQDGKRRRQDVFGGAGGEDERLPEREQDGGDGEVAECGFHAPSASSSCAGSLFAGNSRRPWSRM